MSVKCQNNPQNNFQKKLFNVPGKQLTDFNGIYHIDSIPIEISGLPNVIDSNYGLTKVCFYIEHNRSSDLKIELLSPSGVSIWLSNRNGQTKGANYINTCFRSNGFTGYIHAAPTPFVGEYIPDGRMSFLNNGQNPNGKWFLLVQDLKKEITGIVHYITLEFDKNPNPNSGNGACSFNTPQYCSCNKSTNELLPDLISLPFFTDHQMKEYAQNDKDYPGQLRLAVSIANIGNGPLELFGKNEWFCGTTKVDSGIVCVNGTNPRQIIYQRIYSLDSNKRFASEDVKSTTNYYDAKPGHNHYHVDNWIVFKLIKETKNNKGKIITRKIIAKSNKISYCLFDSGICNSSDDVCKISSVNYGYQNLTNYGLGGYGFCNSNKQGISVGGYDTYGMMYEGQFLVIPPNTPNGDYLVEVEIDPLHTIKESNIKNNIQIFPIKLTKQP